MSRALFLVALVLALDPACGSVQLPGWFSDGMVLQTSEDGGPNAMLAGKTKPPGEVVTITGDVGAYTVKSDAASGYWKVKLSHSSTWRTDAGSSGMQITVKGETGLSITAQGVVVGDVFFCAGQSNMLFSLQQSLNYTAEAASLAGYPNFRFFMTNRALNSTPQFDLTSDDANCDAATPPSPPAPPAPPPPAPGPVGCFLDAWIKDVAWKTGPGLGGVPAASAAECCAVCSNSTMQNKHCKGWSWTPATAPAAATVKGGGGGPAMCWLKTATGGKVVANKGGFSGGVEQPQDVCVPSAFLNNTFYGHGHGPSIGSAPGASAGDCCEQCSNATWNSKGCQYFSYEPVAPSGAAGEDNRPSARVAAAAATGAAGAAGTCWFKTINHGSTRTLSGAVSGPTGGPPPPPAPPSPPKPCNRWVTAAAAAANDAAYLQSFSAVYGTTFCFIPPLPPHYLPPTCPLNDAFYFSNVC